MQERRFAIAVGDGSPDPRRRSRRARKSRPLISPHDLAAERSALGAVLIDGTPENRILSALLGLGLRAEHFFRRAHLLIFAAMVALHARLIVIDFVTLKAELDRTGVLEEVGGPAYIAALADGMPRSANAPYHARIIMERSAARQEIAVLSDTLTTLHADPSAALNGIPGKVAESLARIKNALVQAETSVSESLPDVLARLADVPAREMIVGEILARGETLLLHGQPRDGKTWIALEISVAIATGSPAFGVPRFPVARACRVLLIGNEDSERTTVERLRMLIAGRDLGAVPPEGIRLLLGRGVSLDEADWQERILREVEQQNIDVVVVDPLRSVSAAVDQGPAELKPVATYVRRLIRERGIAVVLVHHDTKPSANGPDTRRRAQKASGGAIFSIADAPVHAERIDDRRTLLTPDGFKHSADPAPLIVTRESGEGWIRIVGEAATGTTAADVALRTKVVEFLNHSPGASGSKVAVGIGANKAAVLATLKAMAEADVLDSVQERRGVRWFVRNAGGAA